MWWDITRHVDRYLGSKWEILRFREPKSLSDYIKHAQEEYKEIQEYLSQLEEAREKNAYVRFELAIKNADMLLHNRMC